MFCVGELSISLSYVTAYSWAPIERREGGPWCVVRTVAWVMAGRWYCIWAICKYGELFQLQRRCYLTVWIDLDWHESIKIFMSPKFHYLNQPLSCFIASNSSYHIGGPICLINSWGAFIPLKLWLISLNIRLSLLWTDKTAMWVCQIIFMLSMASSSCRTGSHGGTEANARLPNCVNN